ncbi:MAG: fasciclin domain-containing protein [Verrucomicrobiae bacterium]|nr:fasciclin domain-containing protein [Verrucomicrobiae bacterium]
MIQSNPLLRVLRTTLRGLVCLALIPILPIQSRAATLVEAAASNPDFSTLVTAVQAAGLIETLSGPGPFTVFAPNNAAFEKLPPGTVEALVADPVRLRSILLYHVVPGRVRSTDLVVGPVITAQGAAATITLEGGPRIDDADIIATNVEASNGVIHVLDSVILPPPTLVEIAAGNPDFSTLVTAVQAAGLVETLSGPGPFTVFAPNNAAFEKLPPGTVEALVADPVRLRSILLYHVVPGRVRSTDLVAGPVITAQGAAATITQEGDPRIDDADIIATNVEASNGVIHVLDSVILPPPTLVEIAAGNPDFSTLVTAVQAAGLAETLSGPGPFTVFAPNNAAFEKLPPGTVEALVADPDRLRHILLYHVRSGPRLRAADLTTGPVATLQGAPLQVVVGAAGVQVNQAVVLAANVEAGNGVLHVVDSVLLPGDGFPEVRLWALPTPDGATVVWPATAAAATLESAPSPGGPWSPVTAPVTATDGILKVSVDSDADELFFRLRE